MVFDWTNFAWINIHGRIVQSPTIVDTIEYETSLIVLSKLLAAEKSMVLARHYQYYEQSALSKRTNVKAEMSS
jgi:hypothetical protein